jgi:ADP-ribosyl-[dinitrogen reductase] hydrolase
MFHPNSKMLLRIAQADAYAMATEYIKFPKDQEIQKEALKFSRFVKHPTHSLKSGQYTDDTQMSIAVSEVLLEGPPFTKEKFADAFVRCFKRDQRKGYSQGFQHLLESIKDGQELLEKLHPDSDKNGAAMRAVPIGVLPNPWQVLEVADTQARITHDTLDGVISARAVAIMSHYALYESKPMNGALLEYVQSYLPEFRNDVWTKLSPVTGPRVGIKTAEAVLFLLQRNHTLLGLLRQCIEIGGDTDSVAAIAWGIASTRMQDDMLPDFFETNLELGGEFGPEFLKQLGQKLIEKYSVP